MLNLNFRTMKKFVFMSLAVIMMTVCLVSCGKPTPSAIAKDCIENIKNGDYKAFAETIDGTDEQKAMVADMLASKAEKQIKKHEGIASYEIVSEEISEDGQTAKVKAEITYGDGKKDDSKFDFKLVDGEWKQEISK